MTATPAGHRRTLLCADAVLPMTAGDPVITDGAVPVSGDLPAYIDEANAAAVRLLTRRDEWLASQKEDTSLA